LTASGTEESQIIEIVLDDEPDNFTMLFFINAVFDRAE